MVQIIIPPHVNHDGGAIYSIDCHPSGEKFLTCGQREQTSSGVIVVWNTSPLVSQKDFENEKVPKVFCQIMSQAVANCGRWSPDGRRFSVGSDDATVSVYEFVGRVNSAGSVLGKAANIERYKECAVLRAHTMEVICVEWSANGKYLASSSMDNEIHIWNAKKLHEKVTTLKGHTMAVKGLSWDPIGKYLATLSADKTMRIWQTDDWKCTAEISKPFEESGQTTMFSRLDWSPDGKYIFAPSATNNKAPTVQIIERQTWSVERDLVGHRKATTCVRALPHLIHTEVKSGKKMQFSCLAVGSRDKSISIWLLPGIHRPVFVLNKIFKHSVMDMMWNGLDLTVCSQDGTVVVLSFDVETLGEVLNSEAMSNLCHSIYRIRPPQYENDGQGQLEDVDMDVTQSNETRMNLSFVTCPEDVLEKRNQEEKSASATGTSEPNGNSNGNSHQIEVEAAENEAKRREKQLLEERQQQVEARKDGKRRIQPMFLASTATGDTVVTTTTTSTVLKQPVKATTVVEEGEDLESSSDEEDEEEVEDEEDDEEEDSDDVMEVDTDDTEDANGIAKKRRKMGRMRRREKRKLTKNAMIAADFRKPILRPIEMPGIKITDGTAVMEGPARQPTLLVNVIDRKNLHLDIDNKWKHGGVETSCIRLIKRKNITAGASTADGQQKKGIDIQWVTIVASPVVLATANKNFCILGCGDRCLRIYRMSCGSFETCLRLDSMPVSLGIREYAAYVLTEFGKLSTWDLEGIMKSVISRQPIYECIESSSKDLSLASIDVSETAIPLMVLTNGSIYTYNVRLACWVQVMTVSIIGRMAAPLNEMQMGDGPLGRLLKRMRKYGSAPNISNTISKAVKESQMEQLLHCAENLGNSSDYQSILHLYAEVLCEHGSEKKLKHLLDDLTKSGAPMMICGLKRAALYEDVAKMLKSRHSSIAARLLTTTNNKNSSLF